MMRRSMLFCALIVGALAAPSQAQGQMGLVLDYINKLSGPGLLRIGPELAVAHLDENRNRINVAPLFTIAVDEHGSADAEAADISAFGIQATLESMLLGQAGGAELRSKLGFEVHHFSGEFDSFWTPSFPMLVSLHVPVGTWALEIGTGFNVFKFQDDAFDGFDVGVDRSGFDAGWTVQAAIEFGNFALID